MDVCLRIIFTYEYINVMTFKYIYIYIDVMLASDALSEFHNFTPSTGMDIALIFIRTITLIK